jgi:hypothetical protein
MNLSLKRRGPAERPRTGDEPRPDGGRGRGVHFALLAFGTGSLMTVAMAVAVGHRPVGAGAPLPLGRRLAPRHRRARLPPGGAQRGRRPAQRTLAFFPGYPLLIEAGSSLTGLSPALVGIILSVLAGAAASVVLWLLAEHVADARTANRAVLLFCFLPRPSCCPWSTARRCSSCSPGSACSPSSASAGWSPGGGGPGRAGAHALLRVGGRGRDPAPRLLEAGDRAAAGAGRHAACSWSSASASSACTS